MYLSLNRVNALLVLQCDIITCEKCFIDCLIITGFLYTIDQSVIIHVQWLSQLVTFNKANTTTFDMNFISSHVLVIVQSLPGRFWYHAWMGRLPALIESVFFTLLGRLDLWLGDALSKFILLLPSILWSHYHTMISHTARLHKTDTTTSICFAQIILLLSCDDYKLQYFSLYIKLDFEIYEGHFMVHILTNLFHLKSNKNELQVAFSV